MNTQLFPVVDLGTEKHLGPIILECKPKASNAIAMIILALLMAVGGAVLVWAMASRILGAGGRVPWFAAKGESLASFAVFGAVGLCLVVFAALLLRNLVRMIGYRLYLCEHGLCAVSGSKREALLWEEIESIEQFVSDAAVRLVKYVPDSMMPHVSGGVLGLRGTDGTQLSIGTDQFPPHAQAELFRAIETEALGRSISWSVREQASV